MYLMGILQKERRRQETENSARKSLTSPREKKQGEITVEE